MRDLIQAAKRRYRADVIEVEQGGAAVRFANGRIEFIIKRGMGPAFTVGMRGWASYVPSLNGYEWTFTPFKGGHNA